MVDFNYYKTSYEGSKITSDEQFKVIEKKAAVFINKITYNNIDEVTDSVKMAVCAVCDVFCDKPSDGILSETNDGYSVSYDNSANLNNEAFFQASGYLPSELLYRGV